MNFGLEIFEREKSINGIKILLAPNKGSLLPFEHIKMNSDVRFKCISGKLYNSGTHERCLTVLRFHLQHCRCSTAFYF